ncbi:RNA polymerase sigma-70 factor [Mucilaginibacter corticis]|uniref:RNA polymerase sigma-70 factor n=1 Tax=Mucilaginibacter corticis TaxID=2597670 RepID=A0A556M9N8_9SPHI|nr:RNA polymerase sigma-70 factor [Mucilaginibacter corticis]TSJ36581.1 RNA polymerase sigma-70 factor [Mucilaginibacter corticis]
MRALNTYTDQELVALLKQDDQRALKEIFERYWDKLLAVALNRLNNLEEAEECVQDVLIKLWNLREKLELRYTLYTYLAAATRYRVLDLLDSQYRKQIKTVELTGQAEILTSNTLADSALLEKELTEKLEDAIQNLPEKCRIVYRMSREEGMANKQIAAELEISEKMVEAHMTRAIKGLSASLPAVILLIANIS